MEIVATKTDKFHHMIVDAILKFWKLLKRGVRYWRTRIHVPIWIQSPNPMTTLYYAEHVHITWTKI